MNEHEQLQEAYKFACYAHYGQLIKNFEIPYVTHCIEVVKILSTAGFIDQDLLSAAVLHDVIEDCGVSELDLEKQFNKKVAELVVECTRINNKKTTKRDKLNFLKSFDNKSEESVFIKIADRYCNVNDYILSGKVKYAGYYALQAYPLVLIIEEIAEENYNNSITKLNEYSYSLRTKGITHLIDEFFGKRPICVEFDSYDKYLPNGTLLDEYIINYGKRK